MGHRTEIELASKTAKNKRTIKIQGWDIQDDSLAKLLEETAKFLRNDESKRAGDGAQLQFKPVATGDLFIVSHRS